MAYVVTQSCCVDASCTLACPVNCIHPAPGEPGFGETEMVFIDADSCVGCGACVTACPAGAIRPDTRLDELEQPFVSMAADFYETFGRERPPLLPVPAQRRLTGPGPFRVAVVGAGPAGMYVADELLKHPEVSVDVFDRLPTPYGLVRGGVAPDHQATRGVEKLFRAVEEQPGFDYRLNVEVGRDVSHDELAAHHDAVVYAIGASADRRLGIDGEDLRGSLPATEVVGWYNAHPDNASLEVPLQSSRAVVIGNGNVALDVARVLTTPVEELARTDISDHALTALRESHVDEVVLVGRRSPEAAAFTMPELIGLSGRATNVRLEGVEPGDLDDPRGRLLAELAERPHLAGRPTITFRFRSMPLEILGEDGSVAGVRLARTDLADGKVSATDEVEELATSLVVRAVGHRVGALPAGLADDSLSHERGRVRPGVYVAGWLKRGPSGFIGTNKTCAEETVAVLLDDLEVSAVTPRPRSEFDELLARRTTVVDRAGWRRIDEEERRRGVDRGANRSRMSDTSEMVAVASQAGRRPDNLRAVDAPARTGGPWLSKTPRRRRSTDARRAGRSTTARDAS